MGFHKKRVKYWEAQDTPPNYFNTPVEETRYYLFNWWFWTSRRVVSDTEVKLLWGK